MTKNLFLTPNGTFLSEIGPKTSYTLFLKSNVSFFFEILQNDWASKGDINDLNMLEELYLALKLDFLPQIRRKTLYTFFSESTLRV